MMLLASHPIETTREMDARASNALAMPSSGAHLSLAPLNEKRVKFTQRLDVSRCSLTKCHNSSSCDPIVAKMLATPR